MIKRILPLIFTVLYFQNSLSNEILKVFEFNDEEFKKLEVRKIKKKTTYTLGSNDKGNFLKAEAQGVASGLGKELKINLNKTPYINITWKVEEDLSGIESASELSSPSTFKRAIKELTCISSVPSGIIIFSIIPSSGDSSSIVALSVSISAKISPELTCWPSLTSHLTKFPCSIVGERAGSKMFIGRPQ